MTESYRVSALSAGAAMLFLFLAAPAHAYLGPGGAVSSIGALLALIGAVVVGILGFLWFPVKRMVSKIRESHGSEWVSANPASTGTSTASSKVNKPSSTEEDSQE